MKMGEKCPCPLLLDIGQYSPDSLNLSDDQEARLYWIQCFADLSKRFVSKVESLYPGDDSAKGRAEQCQAKYTSILESLRFEPYKVLSTDPLSIRELLELNEQFLRENGFNDAWQVQKDIETEAALNQLSERLEEIDRIKDVRMRWKSLCEGLLAGNMFDWGAQAVANILEKPQKFELAEALMQIESRPWLVDHLDKWLGRLEGPRHKCVAIFVDNAGIDFVLGILPTARELLRQGSLVYLCANTLPALNDVTHAEQEMTVAKAAKFCPIIANGLTMGRLKCYETGQKGPCLDLRDLNKDLAQAMLGVDLVILEGMGRALHTNLYAKLSVDCLKMAVIKNEWLANRLGGKKFSVLCQFEAAPYPKS